MQIFSLNASDSDTQSHLYRILFFTSGSGALTLDTARFTFEQGSLFFLTPYQGLSELTTVGHAQLSELRFHGDYYCIEYHREEVACNGLLFNSLSISPQILLSASEFAEFSQLWAQLHAEFLAPHAQDIVLKAYLQLLLAKSSSVKKRQLPIEGKRMTSVVERFLALLEKHYLDLHKPADYAERLHTTTAVLSRNCKKSLGKTPTQLIQQRLVLEAKKKLHLSHQSIKEIAMALHFEDVHYFSRFFKKLVGVSPQKFRLQTGISRVAPLVFAEEKSTSKADLSIL